MTSGCVLKSSPVSKPIIQGLCILCLFPTQYFKLWNLQVIQNSLFSHAASKWVFLISARFFLVPPLENQTKKKLNICLEFNSSSSNLHIHVSQRSDLSLLDGFILGFSERNMERSTTKFAKRLLSFFSESLTPVVCLLVF